MSYSSVGEKFTIKVLAGTLSREDRIPKSSVDLTTLCYHVTEKQDLLYKDTHPIYEVSIFSPSHLPGAPFSQAITMRLTLLLGTKESALAAEVRVPESCLNLGVHPSKSFPLWSPCFHVELIKGGNEKNRQGTFPPHHSLDMPFTI